VRIAQVDRHDLALEPAFVDRGNRPSVRLERERVQFLAGKSPLFGDHLCRDPLRDDLPAVEQLVGEIAAPGAHRDARHHLDTGRDDELELAGPHRGGGAEVRLHRGAALAVDRRPGDRLRPARDERDHAPEVPALLADLGDAAELDVLDLTRVEIVAGDQSVQHLGGELVAADRRQRAVLLADRRAHCVDDQRVGFPSRHAGLD
jgi:hypothetical protein